MFPYAYLYPWIMFGIILKWYYEKFLLLGWLNTTKENYCIFKSFYIPHSELFEQVFLRLRRGKKTFTKRLIFEVFIIQSLPPSFLYIWPF